MEKLHKTPKAWQNHDMSSSMCSADARWRSACVAGSSAGPCPWASMGATIPSYSHWCCVASGYTDRQACMLGHLFSAIIDQRFTQQHGHSAHPCQLCAVHARYGPRTALQAHSRLTVLGAVPTSTPSTATNDRGPAPDSKRSGSVC